MQKEGRLHLIYAGGAPVLSNGSLNTCFVGIEVTKGTLYFKIELEDLVMFFKIFQVPSTQLYIANKQKTVSGGGVVLV